MWRPQPAERCSWAGIALLCTGLWPAQARAEPVRVHLELVTPAALAPGQRGEGHYVVNAGAVDAGGRKQPLAGEVVRWHHGGGAFLVWTFRATVWHPGESARFEIRQAGDASEPELRYALGTERAWTRAAAGHEVPRLGATTVHPHLASGDSITFEVAMALTTSLPAGSYRPSLDYRAQVNERVELPAPLKLFRHPLPERTLVTPRPLPVSFPALQRLKEPVVPWPHFSRMRLPHPRPRMPALPIPRDPLPRPFERP